MFICFQYYRFLQLEIVQFLMSPGKMRYGLTGVDLRKMVYAYAVKQRIKYPTTWDNRCIAGYDWLEGFMNRHKKNNVANAKTVERR